MQYTEVVYYGADGNEVARERQYDDHWYDTGAVTYLDDPQEIEDYFGGES